LKVSTFTVTKPRTYRVTVTDACNQTYSDEINVVLIHQLRLTSVQIVPSVTTTPYN
jgi:hypothetical protein